MKFKEKIKLILVGLSLITKAEEKKLTNEDWAQIANSYKEKYGTSLTEDLVAASTDETRGDTITEEQRTQLQEMIGEEKVEKIDSNTISALYKVFKDLNAKVKDIAGNEDLPKPGSAQIEPSGSVRMIIIGAAPHSSSHLFGITDKFFALEKPWNQTMITRQVSLANASQAEKDTFLSAFSEYVDSFKSRVKQLCANNMLASMNFTDMVKGAGSIDYSQLTDKAGEYVVRRQDLVVAYLRSLPSVASIFPVVSNIQNKEVSPGANFGELSQGYRSGNIFKGNVNFTAEVYSVVDVMFKFKFSDMIALEKQYIGYLNREGSSVVKWTFIEWIMVHFGEILFNEQQRRRVVGVRVPQQNVADNPAMFAADGAIRAIERVEEELKVLPFDDLKVYTSETILDYLEAFYAKVEEILPNMEGMKIYVNQKHRRWYLAKYRAKYGKDTDFGGSKDTLIDTLTPENIIWVPNMDTNCYKVWMTYDKNVESYEDKPQEMTMFYFQRDFEDVKTMSRWKEGSGLLQAGVQYKTTAELQASGRSNQYIFTNFPVTSLAANATTCDGKVNNYFLTGANTGATVITDITSAAVDKVYKIICGSLTNKSTISKAGNFDKISAAWTPTAIGDYIKVYAELEDYSVTVNGETITKTRATGKFLELERKVS